MDAMIITQNLIETVEADAMAALDDWLEEVEAPAWVAQMITDLRLLDQVESQKLWLFGEAGRCAELTPILERLTTAVWQQTGGEEE